MIDKINLCLQSHRRSLQIIKKEISEFYVEDQDKKNGIDLINLEYRQAYEVGAINALVFLTD